MKTQNYRVLKVANKHLMHLKGVMGDIGHVLLRSGDLHLLMVTTMMGGAQRKLLIDLVLRGRKA